MSMFKQLLGKLGPLSKLFNSSSDNQLVSWVTEAQTLSSTFLKQAEAEQVNLNDIPVESNKGTQSLQSIIEGLKDQLLPLIQQFMKNPNPAQLTSLLSNNAGAIDGIKQGLSSGNLSQLLGPNLAKQLQGLLSHFDKIGK